MVFQSYAVWPHKTVFGNVSFPLQVGGRHFTRTEIRRKVDAVLDTVGLEGLESRMSTQLSGGQQQRVALARALVTEPKVLLLDEPLSNLDAKLRDEMRGELLRLQQRLGMTTIYVTHDQVEALAMSNRVAVMRDGLVIQEGTPQEIYEKPADLFVAEFVGMINTLHGRFLDGADHGNRVVETEIGQLQCPTLNSAAPGEEVVVMVRPEDIVVHRTSPAEAPVVKEAKIETVIFGGSVVDCQMVVQGRTLRVTTHRSLSLRPHEEVYLEIPPQACMIIGG